MANEQKRKSVIVDVDQRAGKHHIGRRRPPADEEREADPEKH